GTRRHCLSGHRGPVERGGHRWAPIRAKGDLVCRITAVTSPISPRPRVQEASPYLVKANLTSRVGASGLVDTLSDRDLTVCCTVARVVQVSVGNALVASCGHWVTATLDVSSRRGHR